MKTLTIIVCAVLSLSIGIACASPMLISELNIRPYPGLPEGPKADFAIKVAYANFSVQPADPTAAAPKWLPNNSTPKALSYDFVMNVTNLSDKPATIMMLIASAAQNYTRGTSPLIINGVVGTEGTVRGVYLDGELVNVTWIPNSGLPSVPHQNIREFPNLGSLPNDSSNATFPTDGYWREGVEIADMYMNGNLTYTYMYINGTWTDVTGRVQVPDREDPFSNIASGTNRIVSCMYIFQSPLPPNMTSTETHTDSNGTSTTVTKPLYPADTDRTSENSVPNSDLVHVYTGPGKFNNTWAPHESRLIRLNGTVIAASADVLQYLQSGTVAVHISGQTMLANGIINGTPMDTSSAIDIIQQFEIQQRSSSFVYNSVLRADQVFQADKWGMEVFVKSGS
jgi:hypothetical protein